MNDASGLVVEVMVSTSVLRVPAPSGHLQNRAASGFASQMFSLDYVTVWANRLVVSRAEEVQHVTPVVRWWWWVGLVEKRTMGGARRGERARRWIFLRKWQVVSSACSKERTALAMLRMMEEYCVGKSGDSV